MPRILDSCKGALNYASAFFQLICPHTALSEGSMFLADCLPCVADSSVHIAVPLDHDLFLTQLIEESRLVLRARSSSKDSPNALMEWQEDVLTGRALCIDG